MTARSRVEGLMSEIDQLRLWCVRCKAGEIPTVSERMHRMDARALRGKENKCILL